MKSEFGLLGVILFAVGGAIVSMDFSGIFTNPLSDRSFPMFLGFIIGFLIIGLGLWVIVLSGKPETKQPPKNALFGL
jgi:hypothetical protein